MDQQPFVITIVGAESSGKTSLARQLSELYECSWVPEYAREYLEGLDRPYVPEDLYSIADIQIERILSVLKDVTLIDNRQWATGNQQSTHFPPGPLKGEKLVSDTNSIFMRSVISVIEQTEIMDSSKNIIPPKSYQERVLIIDGGMLTLRMWARIKYGIKIPIVEEALMNDVTSLYLLCRPLKDWEPDPLREAPNLLDRAWIYNQYLKEFVENEYSFQIIHAQNKF